MWECEPSYPRSFPNCRQYHTAIVANVFGRTTREYAEVIRILEDAPGIAAYELNISCPNVEHGGVEFCSSPESAASAVAAVRSQAKRPLWVKLSPVIGRIAEFARLTEDAGADALTIANTYPALAFDIETGEPALGNVTGGLSGPAIRPITVRLVWEASQAVKIPIIGLGGVENAGDAIEYMLAGASAVQVGTAHFADPKASERIVKALKIYGSKHNSL